MKDYVQLAKTLGFTDAALMEVKDLVVVPEYRPEEFYSAVKGLENVPEGGERCFVCYRLRLEYSARYAAEHGFDYFCSTLSISPLKNACKLNACVSFPRDTLIKA